MGVEKVLRRLGEMAKEIDACVGRYLECKGRLDAAKEELDGIKAELIELVGEGGAHETPEGVKVKVTPPSVNERFDWKSYLKDHPDAQRGYMVESRRAASVRVTEPKAEKLDEYGWDQEW